MFDIFSTIIIILASCTVSFYIGKKLRMGIGLSLTIYSIHTLYCVAYWVYSKYYITDAILYYENAQIKGDLSFQIGTGFVTYITKFFVDTIGSSELNTYLVFNMFGVIGCIFLLRILLDIWPKVGGINKFMPYIIMLLPGNSFWSVAIGKDGIAYMSICLLLYGLHRGKDKYILPSIMLMFFVRPHIAIFMLLAYATTYIITSREVKNSIIVKIIILFLIAILGLLSLPYILSYLGISELSIDKIISFIDFRSKVDMGGGSSYDNSGPLIWNAFSFFFRPLFFDARSLFQFVYSFENAIILIILFKYIFLQLHKIIINIKSKIVIYILSYSFSLGLIMVYITSNLGLAVRQKYMILPFLFVLSAIVARHLFIKKNKGSQQLRHV